MSNRNRSTRNEESTKLDPRNIREQQSLIDRSKGYTDKSDLKQRERGGGGGSGNTTKNPVSRGPKPPEMKQQSIEEGTRFRTEGYRDAEFTGRERITEPPPTLRLD